VFKPLLGQAELPSVTFHSLRHTANSLLIEAGEDPLAIAGSLGHSDTWMMFERYGYLFDHTAKRVAQTADRICAALEPNCRTIVVNAADRFGLPRRKNAKIHYRIRRFRWWRWGDSNPRPLTCEASALPAELHPHAIVSDPSTWLRVTRCATP
jgi:Phage integrase family